MKSDTKNAIEMAGLDKPSCIMRHDYRSWGYTALTCYRGEFSEDHQIFHMHDTTLCAWFNDRSDSIVPRLFEGHIPILGGHSEVVSSRQFW